MGVFLLCQGSYKIPLINTNSHIKGREIILKNVIFSSGMYVFMYFNVFVKMFKCISMYLNLTVYYVRTE